MLFQIPGRCFVEASTEESKCTFEFEKTEGSRKAWKAAGICMGLAILSVFIPLAHFVLVPAFLIAAPIAFVWYKKHPLVTRLVSGQCPHCQNSFQLKDQRPVFPMETFCENCRKRFKLQPTDDKALASLEHP